MANRTCTVPECDNNVHGWGYCTKHYKRFRRYGDPMQFRPMFQTPEESFKARTQPDGDCIVWIGAHNGVEYGIIALPGGKGQLAHRYSWERVEPREYTASKSQHFRSARGVLGCP